MDLYSSLWTHPMERWDQADSKWCGISQHSFGFVHGFVLCLVLKKLHQETHHEGLYSDMQVMSLDYLSPSSDRSDSGGRGDVPYSEVKEEALSDVQAQPDDGVGQSVVLPQSPTLPLYNAQCSSAAAALQQPEVVGKEAVHRSSFYLQLSDGTACHGDSASDHKLLSSLAEEQESIKAESETGSAVTNHVLRKRKRPAGSQAAQSSQRKRQHTAVRKSTPNSVQRSKSVMEETSSFPLPQNTVPDTCDTQPLSGSQPHTCSKCNKTFTTARSLRRHMVKVHQPSTEGRVPSKKDAEKLLQAHCDKCPKVYTGGRAEKNLQQHVLAYHCDLDPVQCDVCNITLNNHHHLKLHKRSSHRKDVCYICGAHFVTQAGLQTHLLAHKGDKTFVCEICGAAFVRVSSLRQHTKFHSDSRDFKCSMCTLSFKTFSSLSIHMMCVHQRGGYFNSQVQKVAKLGYVVDADSLQRVHKQLCVACGQGLVGNTCPSHPTDCMLSFSCPQCQWTTKDIQKFHKHLVRRNSSITCSALEPGRGGRPCGGLEGKARPVAKNFICASCGKRFYTQSHLKAHKHQHAEKRFSCPVCDKTFTYKFNMQNHLTTHTDARPFECQVCHKTFKMKSQLQLHRRFHEGEFTCQVCGKVLTRKQHVINHYKLVHPDRQLVD